MTDNAEQTTEAPRRHGVGTAILTGVVGVLAVVSVVGLFTEIWLFRTWESLSVDEVFYHLNVSLEGTNTSMIADYALFYGIPILLVLAVVFFVLFKLRTKGRAYYAALAAVCALSLGALGWALNDMDARMGLFDYVADSVMGTERADFVEENFVDAPSVQISFPQQKKNLIYIFAESMETTFADKKSGGAFERNVIPELTQLALDNECFNGGGSAINGAVALPGTQWTMGGMFAQTSGLPLKLPMGGNAMEDASSFFPGITTLGDVLADQGYEQVLMLGSDAKFGGRDLYFTEHGGYTILDYETARTTGVVPRDYRVFWGIEDEKLFSWARDTLTELAAQDKPFNLTMLTVDTHFEDGYVCDLCGDEFGDNQYANVYACASRQISQFVAWVGEQDFAADTVIVIAGDHTTMDTDFCAQVPGDYQRKAYVAIVNGSAQPAADKVREASTLDLFPTTLAALGATIPGNRLGLGTNLYADEETLVERHGMRTCTRELNRPSSFLSRYLDVAISEAKLEQVRKQVELEAKPAGSRIEYGVYFDNVLAPEAVMGAKLAVKDTRTGEERTMPMSKVTYANDPNVFKLEAAVDCAPDDLDHIEATVLITGNGFEDFPVASL